MFAKRIIVAPLLAVLCTMVFYGCTKQSQCGDSEYSISWNDYNSVKTVYCYLDNHYREHSGDTVLVKGYLDETFEYMEYSYPWLYLADKVWEFTEDYGHLRLSMGVMGADSVTTDYRNKLLYVKGSIGWEFLDGGSRGYSVFLKVWAWDIDTIAHK